MLCVCICAGGQISSSLCEEKESFGSPSVENKLSCVMFLLITLGLFRFPLLNLWTAADLAEDSLSSSVFWSSSPRVTEEPFHHKHNTCFYIYAMFHDVHTNLRSTRTTNSPTRSIIPAQLQATFFFYAPSASAFNYSNYPSSLIHLMTLLLLFFLPCLTGCVWDAIKMSRIPSAA